MERIIDFFKYMGLMVLVYLIYRFLPTICTLPFYGVLNNCSNLVKSLILLGIEVFVAFTIILIYIKDFIKDFKDFKANFKKYIPRAMLFWLIGFFGMGLMNIIINLVFNTGVSENEELNRLIIKQYPLYAIPAIAIIGPLTEELVYRFNFRKVLKNKTLFIIITSIIFASAHLEASFSSVSDLITNFTDLFYFFPYCALALAFAFAYRDNDNIFSSLSIHIFHNSYCLIMILIGMMFK